MRTEKIGRLVLVCVYRKQEVPLNIFDEEFTAFMDKVSNRGEVLLVVGDFNVWIGVTDDPDADGEPTHREGH